MLQTDIHSFLIRLTVAASLLALPAAASAGMPAQTVLPTSEAEKALSAGDSSSGSGSSSGSDSGSTVTTPVTAPATTVTTPVASPAPSKAIDNPTVNQYTSNTPPVVTPPTTTTTTTVIPTATAIPTGPVLGGGSAPVVGGGDAPVAEKEIARGGGELPYTGLSVGLLFLIGFGFVGFGVSVYLRDNRAPQVAEASRGYRASGAGYASLYAPYADTRRAS